MSELTLEEKEIQDYCRKAGQAPLTKDELKMVKYGIYLAPQMAHTKKLEEDCPDCKGEKTKLVKRPNGRETRIDYRCPTCQGTGKKLAPDRGEIARKLAELDNWNFDELPGKPTGLTSGVNKSHYLYRADQITALMEGRRLPISIPV